MKIPSGVTVRPLVWTTINAEHFIEKLAQIASTADGTVTADPDRPGHYSEISVDEELVRTINHSGEAGPES